MRSARLTRAARQVEVGERDALWPVSTLDAFWTLHAVLFTDALKRH
jgi:hypothetical protein